jgi:hypothetical protein
VCDTPEGIQLALWGLKDASQDSDVANVLFPFAAGLVAVTSPRLSRHTKPL